MNAAPTTSIELVDAEVQNSISNLVSALGGFDARSGEYKLGDEALNCLRDLRKWLQNYDAKYDSLDVACAIANTTLVTSDLLEILASWERNRRKERSELQDKIARACLELLVPLTWPLSPQKEKEVSTEYLSKYTSLKWAYKRYKDAIISHPKHSILVSILRLAARCELQVAYNERSKLNEGVLTLAVSLFRNLLDIDGDDDEERRTTILEYKRQKVLSFLVTLGSGMGKNFVKQDFLLLECLYYLLRGIDPNVMYGLKDETEVDNKKDLLELLETEKKMALQVPKSSRHSRFGTLIAIKEGNGRFSSLSGQRGVSSIEASLNGMNNTKKWNKPSRGHINEEEESTSYYSQIASAVVHNKDSLNTVTQFSSDFLDGSFNCAFETVRKSFEEPVKEIGIQTYTYFLYLSAWFLHCERARAEVKNRSPDFKLVGACLSDNSLQMTMELLKRSIEPGEFRNPDLCHAAIVCLAQTLMTIRDMSYAKQDDLRDISEGMRARFFYEEEWLQLLADLPRNSSQKSLAYISDVALLTRNCLKMLDEYSKEHTYLFVKSKRRKAAKSRTKQTGSTEADGDDGDDGDEGGEGVDEQTERDEAERVTTERRFNFSRFVLKYANVKTIEMYERILENHEDASDEVMLAVFSFFRRVFGKTPCKAVFFRMSLIRLLLVVSDAYTSNAKVNKTVNEFLTYYVQKFVQVSKRFPSIHVNLAGTMTQDEAFFYDNSGQQRVSKKKVVDEYEFELSKRKTEGMSEEKKFAVVVASLIDLQKEDFVQFVYDKLQQLVINGIKQEKLTSEESVVERVKSDALLRLFLRSLGIVLRLDVDLILVPGDIDVLTLIQQLEWMDKYSKEPVELDGKDAMDFIRNTADGDDDEDDNNVAGNVEDEGSTDNDADNYDNVGAEPSNEHINETNEHARESTRESADPTPDPIPEPTDPTPDPTDPTDHTDHTDHTPEPASPANKRTHSDAFLSDTESTIPSFNRRKAIESDSE